MSNQKRCENYALNAPNFWGRGEERREEAYLYEEGGKKRGPISKGDKRDERGDGRKGKAIPQSQSE